MTRLSHRFSTDAELLNKLVQWTDRHAFGFCFRGAGWGSHFGKDFQAFAGAGTRSSFVGTLKECSAFVDSVDDYVISHFTYDLKNELEHLSSENPDQIDFVALGLTVPEWVIIVQHNEAQVLWHANASKTGREIQHEIEAMPVVDEAGSVDHERPIARMSKPEYLDRISQIQHHIQQGDIYQANLCQEFHWNVKDLDPAALFNRGFNATPNPFSVFYKIDGKHCLCLSPERYLHVEGNTVMSQPMKGTSPRSDDPEEDHRHYEWLRHSEKDRRENVMIVDMVRNDLSHFAVPGSVKVPELYRIEAYPKVHQMFSTVTAQFRSEASLVDVLLKAFPMGSMTGAPKIRAMKRIEQYEMSKRGLFSGSIGFITPQKNADFNVVIRSLLYSKSNGVLSAHVGGGITALSDAESEYEECMVKFEPLRQLIREACVVRKTEPERSTFAG